MDRARILDAKVVENPIDPLAFRGPIGESPVLGFGTGVGHFVVLAALPTDKTAKDKRAIPSGGATIHNRPGEIYICVYLHSPVRAAWEKQALPRAAFQVR